MAPFVIYLAQQWNFESRRCVHSALNAKTSRIADQEDEKGEVAYLVVQLEGRETGRAKKK
jgi:hypothetical protein